MPPSDWRLRRASRLPPRTQISSYGHGEEREGGREEMEGGREEMEGELQHH